jgi:hypothetical protein
LEVAAIQTLLNKGTVYVLEPEKMSDTAPLVTVLSNSFSTPFPSLSPYPIL